MTTLTRDVPTMLDADAVQNLRSQLRRPLLTREDAEFEAARAVYNGMIDKRPALIAQCADVADVMAAVRFARESGVEVAIRSGGHNGPGLGTCEDGLVIDLSQMNGVRVDPVARTARVEGGSTWGDVDHATHAFGLATVSGVLSTTGVGGLTLGGGHGYLTRKYGLTIDNLLSADVVLADGSLVHAGENENDDLFWALRGGGGNFGVVTSFEYRLHPVSTIIGGPMFWPIHQLEETLRWYRRWLPELPEDVYAFYLTAEVPAGEPFPESIQGRKVCGLLWCCTGPEDEARSAMQEARDVAEPLFELTGPMPYPALQSMFDDLYPPGDQWYWKGDFVRELTDEAIAEHLRFAEVPTAQSTMHLYPVDAAVHRMGEDETAWRFRDVTWSMVIAGVDRDPANRDVISRWARDYWRALHPHSAGGAYINFMMEEGEERIRGTYGANYPRLQAIKAKYDPENLFCVNQNIVPANEARATRHDTHQHHP